MSGYLTRAGRAWMRGQQRTRRSPLGDPLDLDNHPVVGVSWYEAVAFCRWLSEQLGLEADAIHLPTDAQWEKAARGTDGRVYPWGDEFDEAACNHGGSGIRTPSPVGMFPRGRSPCGALDMAGNVWEWCSTRWPGSEKRPVDDEPEGGDPRVVRGGSFRVVRRVVRCACRGGYDPDLRNDNIGFRDVAPF